MSQGDLGEPVATFAEKDGECVDVAVAGSRLREEIVRYASHWPLLPQTWHSANTKMELTSTEYSAALLMFLQALDDSSQADGDAWSDDGVVHVGQLAAQLGDSDVLELHVLWRHRAPIWQKHCAEVLDAAPTRPAVALLMDMVAGGAAEVGFAALESLRSFDPADFQADQRADIRRALAAWLARPIGPLQRRVLEAFEATLRASARADGAAGEAPGSPDSSQPESRPSLTAAAIAAVQASPLRLRLPREGVLSLPVPIMNMGLPHLAFFWASQGGPAVARRFSAPYCRTLVYPARPLEASFEPLAPGALGIPAGAFLLPTVGKGLVPAERKAALAMLSAVTDDALLLFAERRGALCAKDRRALQAYASCFADLAVVALFPAYRALSPGFFTWLEAADLEA